MSGSDWSDEENALIVSDYFDMLRADLTGRRYVKAEHNRSLQEKLSGRSRGSIEFKHQNLSAVLLGLGQPWIAGYKPASQFQLSLIDAVLAELHRSAEWSNLRSEPAGPRSRKSSQVREPEALWVGPAPTFSNEPSPIDTERMAAISQKYNVAERDAQNRLLGEQGERYVLDFEEARLRNEGRKDLSKQIVWTSKEIGDGAGYDISSFEADGSRRLIEVKTTNGWERTPFHISKNELDVANQNRETWTLLRLWNFARTPKAFEIRPPLEAHIELTPTSFLASLN